MKIFSGWLLFSNGPDVQLKTSATGVPSGHGEAKNGVQGCIGALMKPSALVALRRAH